MTKINPALLLAPLSLFLTMCASTPEERPSAKDYSRSAEVCSESGVNCCQPDTKKRKLCVFMDGTANDYDSHTNVRRLYELISAPRDPNVLCYYDPGVGSNELPLAGKIGGAGFSKNVSQAHVFLRQNYCAVRGDEIYLFGFSRGARQVQVLCDFLNECGLPPVNADGEWLSLASTTESEVRTRFRDEMSSIQLQSRKLFINYKRYLKERRRQLDERNKYPLIAEQTGWKVPIIKFVGIFDNVESMANNVLNAMAHQSLRSGNYQDHIFYEYDFPSNVVEAYHAMALDEMRGLYEVIKWVRPQVMPHGQNLEQVWFAGSHGDVGGGYESTQSLSAIPLNWMLGKLDHQKHDLFPQGFRVYYDQTFEAPITDSREFLLPGKVLRNIRSNVLRYDYFWYEFFENPRKPSSLKYSNSNLIRPLVHNSVVKRMQRTFPPKGRSELEEYGQYRPWVFSAVPAGLPDIYDGDPSNGLTAVDFESLREVIQIINE